MEQCDGRVIFNDYEPAFKKTTTTYHCEGELFCNTKIPTKMPNEMYISFNSSESSCSTRENDKPDYFCRSTPASPEETERNRQLKTSFHSPMIDKKLPFSFSTSFVRTSKSEDHLRKASLTTVNIDIEDELASSLDTLLDTKADDVFCDLERDEGLNCSCPDCPDSFGSNLTSSDPASKVSVKIRDRHSEPLSESSGSEIIPSDHSSSSTIRRDDSDEFECTSDQISAISSLDDTADVSRATDDSDLGSPVESLSPEVEMDAWNGDLDPKECFPEVFQDITNKNKAVSRKQNIELKPSEDAFKSRCSQPSPTVPKVPDDASTESPTSPLSDEDTFADLSYHELSESYDEVSAMIEVAEISIPRTSESPPTTDDESDIESLHSFHYSPKAVDLPSAVRLAKRLFTLDGFKKTDVSRHLSKK